MRDTRSRLWNAGGIWRDRSESQGSVSRAWIVLHATQCPNVHHAGCMQQQRSWLRRWKGFSGWHGLVSLCCHAAQPRDKHGWLGSRLPSVDCVMQPLKLICSQVSHANQTPQQYSREAGGRSRTARATGRPRGPTRGGVEVVARMLQGAVREGLKVTLAQRGVGAAVAAPSCVHRGRCRTPLYTPAPSQSRLQRHEQAHMVINDAVAPQGSKDI